MTDGSEVDTAACRARWERWQNFPDQGRDWRTPVSASAADVPGLCDALDAARAALARANDYHPDGRCRACGGGRRRGAERPHATWCRLYVGPVTHRWARTALNGTFGGIDHYCACGGWFRQGGMAGHGDGSETAEPICPKLSETHRGNAAVESSPGGGSTFPGRPPAPRDETGATDV